VVQRYHQLYKEKPLVRLLTPEGAELHSDDCLADVLADTADNARVEAAVIGWDAGRMDERYRGLCSELKTAVMANVAAELAAAHSSASLRLPSGLEPILRSRVTTPRVA
jgi:hypothetical protein